MSVYSAGHVDTIPEKAQYNKVQLQKLADYYNMLVINKRVQAAGFLLSSNGQIFAHQATGKLTFEANSPDIKCDSIKKVASITKLFTATAIMKLVEDGVLWLEQPLKTILPEFDNQMYGNINLWHLLTHTSGLPADPGYFFEPFPVDFMSYFSHKNWIEKILTGPIQSSPGENWNYCSLGFAILAEVVSRVSGQHFNDYVQDHIFKPLKMTRSFMEIPDNLKSEICISNIDDYKDIEIANSTKSSGRAPRGGGGAYSTMYDLFRFGQCFVNGGELDGNRILGRKTVEVMTRNQLEGVYSYHWGKKCKNYRQGLGWSFFSDGPTVSPETYNHEGWGWCSLFIDPTEKFIYISFSADYTAWDPDVMVKPRTIAFSGIV